MRLAGQPALLLGHSLPLDRRPRRHQPLAVRDRAAAEATAVVRNARRALRSSSSIDRRPQGRQWGRLARAVNELDTLLDRAAQVTAQARVRLCGGKPDSATRLVSLHDPQARPIRKGRLARPVEFGYKAQVVD